MSLKNPYRSLLNTPQEKSNVWEIKPETEFEKMSLTRKADVINEMIIDEFCEWTKSLGDNDDETDRKNLLKKMFEINISHEAAKDVPIETKHITTLSNALAQARNQPGLSQRALLRQNLIDDIKATRKCSKKQTKPVRNKWFFSPEQKHDDLITAKTVFENILSLRSTQAYCEWLKAHPQHSKPTYLMQMHMFE